MSDTTDDDFLGLLDQLGMSELGKPTTPEEDFYNYICVYTNKNIRAPNLADMTTWLYHAIGHYEHMLEHGLKLCRLGVDQSGKVLKEISPADYTRVMLEYFLLMRYCPRFQGDYYIGSTLARKCDMSITLDMFMNMQEIKNVYLQKKLPSRVLTTT